MLWKKIKYYLFLFVAFFVSESLFAQNFSATHSSHSGPFIDVNIYFPYDESYIDLNYMDNKKNLNIVDSLLRDTIYISTLASIEITAQSSPEGTVEYNERLSERRRLSIKEYFTKNYPWVDVNLWSFKAMAENWELFHEHLEQDKHLPYKKEILSIVDSDRHPDQKEWLLKTMHNGKPWAYIKQNILPTQRFGASVLFVPLESIGTANIAKYEFRRAITEHEIEYNPIQKRSESENPKTLVALRSNLIFDAASVVNIAAEVPLGNRFSLAVEVVYPWWRSWPSNFTMQVESYHAEFKYWLGKRTAQNRLTGLSVGLYGGWGLYDVQLFSENGVQGDFFDVGAMLGYSHRVATNLYLEYTLGLAYVSTDYNDYYMAYGTSEYNDIKVIAYPWMNNKLSAVLPTRVGVALVWHICSKGKGGSK